MNEEYSCRYSGRSPVPNTMRVKIIISTAMEEIRTHCGWLAAPALALVIGLGSATLATAQTALKANTKPSSAVSDAAIVRSLPGFENGYATVNEAQLHYVAGGKGAPLVLLPGWPETWWEFHSIMPTLANRYHVIVVDLRGMGGSSKPQSGYDKKNMAEDIY